MGRFILIQGYEMICFIQKACKINWIVLLVLFSQAIFAANNSNLIFTSPKQTTVAGTPLACNVHSPHSCFYVATLSAGPIWEKGGKTQSFFLAPEIEKTYAANKSTKSLALVELFLGIQKPLMEKLYGQLGFAAAITGDAHLSGEIWDDANAEFNNYNYSYQIEHKHLSLKAKVLIDVDCLILPWVSGSMGVGFNEAHQFSNTPKIFEAVQNPNFSSHTKTSFTYAVGAGFDVAMTKNWQAGVGYEFADWGKSQLNRAQGQTIGKGLSLSHFYTQGLLLNITYLA